MQSIKFFLAILLAIVLVIVGCARDTNEDSGEEKYPLEVKMAFRTRGSFDTNTWYFTVFNFTAAPSTDITTAPMNKISDVDRGKDWELYVALNTNTMGEDTLVSLQRPAVPTLLPVGEEPVDVVVLDINHDNLMDVVVACRTANEIQYLLGQSNEETSYEAVYFDSPFPINNGGQPFQQPFRLFSGAFSGEDYVDILALFAGEDGSSPSLRILAGNASGSLDVEEETILAPGVPIDALVADFNGDSILDVALVTTDEAGGNGELRIILREIDESFNEFITYPLGTDPGQIAVGQLNEDGVDLAVAIQGTAANDGEVEIFYGAGDGTFTALATPLIVDGTCTSVSLGVMFGIMGDVLDDVLVGYVDSAGVGNVGVFLNNPVPEGETPGAGEAFGEWFVSTPTQIHPSYVVAFNTGDDNYLDALVVDGSTGSGSNTFLIQRGLTEQLEGLSSEFIWDVDPITYPSGVEPSRILIADVDGNGVMDVLTPNSANVEGGNSVSLFYGLGKDNFTSADVFWVDREPELLTHQDWYINHTVGPNYFELVIDPGLFYDLAQQPPTSFNVDFMTATAGIDIANNIDHLGEVIENFSTPINIPMTIGYFMDEQNLPKVNVGAVALGAEDIVDWRVEVY